MEQEENRMQGRKAEKAKQQRAQAWPQERVLGPLVCYPKHSV